MKKEEQNFSPKRRVPGGFFLLIWSDGIFGYVGSIILLGDRREYFSRDAFSLLPFHIAFL